MVDRGGDATGLTARSRARERFPWKHVAAVVWLLTTVALAGWWMVFGLHQLQRVAGLGAQPLPVQLLAAEVERQHRMLLSEGSTLIALLLIGGATLLYYIHTEIRRAQKIQEFFAAFTHDLKTSLASLRLQAESLEEDLQDSGQAKIARRLVKDTVRLELQLENSLLLASPDDSRLVLEDCDVASIIEPMRHHWPDLDIVVRGDGTVVADARALESIFKNMFQNAVVHGRATQTEVTIEAGEPGKLRIRTEDNGRGFSGDRTKLGRMFHRHSTSSGSGLGLYLASKLCSRMNGDLNICESVTGGFCLEISLPGKEAGPENHANEVRP